MLMTINEEFLSHLESQLVSNGPWPQVYMFKFIIVDNSRNYAILRNVFNDESKFTTRHSSKGNYLSVTVRELMMDPVEVIDRYRRVAIIDDIITL